MEARSNHRRVEPGAASARGVERVCPERDSIVVDGQGVRARGRACRAVR